MNIAHGFMRCRSHADLDLDAELAISVPALAASVLDVQKSAQ